MHPPLQSNQPSPTNSNHDPLTEKQGLQIKDVITSSIIMSIVILFINVLLTIMVLFFLSGDVYALLSIFYLLESGILFLLSGLHAILGTSPSLNLLIGKLFKDNERPLRMQQMQAIHRAIDYFVSAITLYIASFVFFKVLAIIYT